MIEMNEMLNGILTGVGGTLIPDIWPLFMVKGLKSSATNWPMVGRWIGNMPRGQFVQSGMELPARCAANPLNAVAPIALRLGAAHSAVLYHDAGYGGGCGRLQERPPSSDTSQECRGLFVFRSGDVCQGTDIGGCVACIRAMRHPV